MPRKRKYKYDYNYGNTSPNFYMLLILVLIVLQWFRPNTPAAGEAASGVLSEPNLTTNGGLFIITLFFLAACSCEFSSQNYGGQVYHRHRYKY